MALRAVADGEVIGIFDPHLKGLTCHAIRANTLWNLWRSGLIKRGAEHGIRQVMVLTPKGHAELAIVSPSPLCAPPKSEGIAERSEQALAAAKVRSVKLGGAETPRESGPPQPPPSPCVL
ncbi:hypothetical protein CT676_39070 [Bradyrhizobium sp. MOS001]|uniref:hypothetical protein n=1 Tax=Bradyrhizobium TaxID=374 RepID=UPI00040D65CB|nr:MULTISPECIES: hypothetical protein [Bradyrhizobium]MCS3897381.1 hypothetical protein [Bradyrhizobium japonicum USDA 38]MCS3949896.1 hypothetical protein [Bradyrhizobium japonicum]TFW55745.1 hypothetical protein CT676_39070 [Bradyrhizobium sp. MOS001]